MDAACFKEIGVRLSSPMERYKEIKRIGKGSFGTVFLYEDVVSKEKVVVKKIGTRYQAGGFLLPRDVQS